MAASVTEDATKSPKGRKAVRQLYVDPARCRIRPNHNRLYSRLTPENCEDLIPSLSSRGQESAAIVRAIEGDPDYDCEIICGGRRHYAVTYIRKTTDPSRLLLVEYRALTDHEAFLLADSENRSRKDLSDYERSQDYLRALETLYGGRQVKMAEALSVTQTWLSRTLDIAMLPAEIVAPFGDPSLIGISHAAKIAPALKKHGKHDEVFAAAALLTGEQTERRENGKPLLSPAAVLKRLLGKSTPDGDTITPVDEMNAGGQLVGRGTRLKDDFTIRMPGAALRPLSELQVAAARIIAGLIGNVQTGEATANATNKPTRSISQGQGKPARAAARKRPARSIKKASVQPDEGAAA